MVRKVGFDTAGTGCKYWGYSRTYLPPTLPGSREQLCELQRAVRAVQVDADLVLMPGQQPGPVDEELEAHALRDVHVAEGVPVVAVEAHRLSPDLRRELRQQLPTLSLSDT